MINMYKIWQKYNFQQVSMDLNKGISECTYNIYMTLRGVLDLAETISTKKAIYSTYPNVICLQYITVNIKKTAHGKNVTIMIWCMVLHV